MRIAWITYGFEEYSALHVNAMASEHSLLLVMPQPQSGDPEYAIDSRIEHYSFVKPRLRQPLRQGLSIRKMLRRIQEFQPEIVHFQQGHMWFNLALPWLKRCPLMATIHDPRHHAGDAVSRKTPQWLIDFGFRQANHAIVHGEALATEVAERFHFAADQIHVIPHVAMGGPTAAPEAEDPWQVLFFGRIWEYKGLEYLIRAEPLISRECPQVKIVIAGEGDDFARYRAQMQHPERFVVHNRWVSDEERGTMFQRSALVVLPYNEATQSGVAPVAHNYSKPVVATRVGALAECIDHERTGLLVAPRDPAALADAIVRMLKDPVRRRQMGAAGKERLQRDCSPQAVAAKTVAAYQAALGLPARDRVSPLVTPGLITPGKER